jgi:hypothetical protein
VSELLALATRARNAAKDSIAEHEKVSHFPCYHYYHYILHILNHNETNDDIKHSTKKFLSFHRLLEICEAAHCFSNEKLMAKFVRWVAD